MASPLTAIRVLLMEVKRLQAKVGEAHRQGLWQEAERLRVEVAILLNTIRNSQDEIERSIEKGKRNVEKAEQSTDKDKRYTENTKRYRAIEQAFAHSIGSRWRREAARRGLSEGWAPIPARWYLAGWPAVPGTIRMGNTRVAGVLRRGALVGTSDRVDLIARQISHAPRRRLVITGEPGSGKTSLAILLQLELLMRRPPDGEVPVLLSIVGWDPATEDFDTWVVRQLCEEYPDVCDAWPEAARALVDAGSVLPVLDGLDEIPSARRPGVLEMLHAATGDRPWILTCRAAEFRAAEEEIGGVEAAVIEAGRLDVDEIQRYLTSHVPPQHAADWHPVIAILAQLSASPTGPLATVLRSPLYLDRLRVIYLTGRSTAPRPTVLLGCRTEQDLRAHLLDGLVPAVFGSGPVPGPRQRTWNPQRAQRWLTHLASHFNESRDICWWKLAPRHTRGFLFATLVGISYMLMMLAALAPLFVFTPWPTGESIGPLLVLLTALGAGPAFPFGFRSTGGFAAKTSAPARIDLNRNGGRSLAGDLVTWTVVGLVAWIIGELIFRVLPATEFDPSAALVGVFAGIPIGLGLKAVFALTIAISVTKALVHGFAFWATRPAGLLRSPKEAVRDDARTVLMSAIENGIVPGIAAGIIAGFLGGPIVALTLGLAAALASGPIDMITDLPRPAWMTYRMAHLWLVLHRRLPWSFLEFLDDAYRLGLLRQVGGTYQFRNSDIHDSLAAQDASQLPGRSPMRASPSYG